MSNGRLGLLIACLTALGPWGCGPGSSGRSAGHDASTEEGRDRTGDPGGPDARSSRHDLDAGSRLEDASGDARSDGGDAIHDQLDSAAGSGDGDSTHPGDTGDAGDEGADSGTDPGSADAGTAPGSDAGDDGVDSGVDSGAPGPDSGTDPGPDPGPDPSPHVGLSVGYVAPAHKMGVHDQPRIGGHTDFALLRTRWSRLSSVLGRTYSQYNIWWSGLEPREGTSAFPVPANFCPDGEIVPRSPAEKGRFGYKRYHCYNSAEVARFDNLLSLDHEFGVQSGAVIWSSPSFVRHPDCEGFPWSGTVLKDGCVPRDEYMDDFEDYVRFLGRRYNGYTPLSNGRTAKLAHFIVWNEAGSTEWTDLSPLAPRTSTEPQHVALRVAKYAELMRRAHAALKSVTSAVMLYASTDHLWENDGSFPPGHMGSRRLLEGLWAELGIDMAWSVAVHPYGPPSGMLSGRYTFRNLNVVSDFQRAMLRARGIEAPSPEYPQPYLIASEQGGWSIGDPAGKARAICEAHAEALKANDLLLVAHNYFHQATWDPDVGTFGLVPRSVDDDLSNLLETPEGRAFGATSPSEWSRTGEHECCRASGVGCGSYPLSRAESNDVLDGWGPENAIDGRKASHPYSSNGFPNANNDRGTYIAAWVANGPVQVGSVRLYPRLIGSSPAAFPRRYEVFLTSPDNSAWLPMGTYSTQPSSGVAVLDVRQNGSPPSTFGVLVHPLELGQDDGGGYYFQLDELELAP